MNAAGHIVFRRAPVTGINSDGWCNVRSGDSDSPAERRMSEGGWVDRLHGLPISYCSVTVKDALR